MMAIGIGLLLLLSATAAGWFIFQRVSLARRPEPEPPLGWDAQPSIWLERPLPRARRRYR